MVDNPQLTQEGYERLQREIEELETVTIPEALAKIQDIRDDVGNEEDPELNAALEEKIRLDEHLSELRYILSRAEILEEDLDPDHVNIGDTVVVLDIEENEEMQFTLLHTSEISAGREGISTESPVGKALLGKRVGDVVDVEVPAGMIQYKITGFVE